MLSMQVNFKLAQPGLMKDFAGKWTVQPFTQDTLDELYNQGEQPASAAPWHSLTSSIAKRESSMFCSGLAPVSHRKPLAYRSHMLSLVARLQGLVIKGVKRYKDSWSMVILHCSIK